MSLKFGREQVTSLKYQVGAGAFSVSFSQPLLVAHRKGNAPLALCSQKDRRGLDKPHLFCEHQ